MRNIHTLIGVVSISGATLIASITFGQPPGFPFPVPIDKQISKTIDHFMEADVNLDGKLSKAEAKQLPPFAAFEHADTNKDGVLTREELTTFLKKDIPKFGGGPGGPGVPDGMEERGAGRKGAGGRAGMGVFGQTMLGQVLPEPTQEKLKLTIAQKKKIQDLQKLVDAKIARILTNEQDRQFAEMKQSSPNVPERTIETAPVAADLDRPSSETKSTVPTNP